MLKPLIIYISLLLFCGLTSQAQKKTFHLINNDSSKTTLEIIKSISSENSNHISAQKSINELLLAFYSRGYLSAHIDSIKEDKVYFTAGKPFQLIKLSPGNIDQEILNEIHFKNKLFQTKPLNYKNIEILIQKILSHCENNGFPFAEIKLDSISISDSEFSARINLQKNQKIILDSINIIGSTKTNPNYIYNFIGIKPLQLYDETKIKNINKRFNELSFIQQTKLHELVFTKQSNKLNLYLDEKKSSQFNGILGVLPNNQDPTKILFTGDAFFKTQNSFRQGELVEFNWRKLQSQTQDLKIHLLYPFIFKSPFSVDYKLELYKRDTSFLNVSNNIGIQYWLTQGNYLKTFYCSKNSNVLNQPTGLSQTNNILADIKSKNYGIEIKKEIFDYKLNPRKGYTIYVNGSVGNRIISDPVVQNKTSDNPIQKNNSQYQLEFGFDTYMPLFKNSTIRILSQSASIRSNSLFRNELYRIGGLKSLRGFDEESIFASTYSLLNIEYRYLLEKNSYLQMFWNGAWYQAKTIQKNSSDMPFGFGLGINFESQSGIFSITYALGKEFHNPINFKTGKIHFGFVSYF